MGCASLYVWFDSGREAVGFCPARPRSSQTAAQTRATLLVVSLAAQSVLSPILLPYRNVMMVQCAAAAARETVEEVNRLDVDRSYPSAYATRRHDTRRTPAPITSTTAKLQQTL